MNKFATAALASLFLTAGCSKAGDSPAAPPPPPPVATVNGSAISQEVWEFFVRARHNGKNPGELTAEEQGQALDDLVRMYIGSQEAEKQQLVTGEARARLELVRHSSQTELLFRKFNEGKTATEEELKAEYDRRIAELPAAEFHARHILVDDEALAKDLIAQLDQGGNFEELARKHSKDGSAQEGGDLNWFIPGQMVKPFADAVQQLEKGKYTATPVQSEFGWHVIRLEDTRPTTPPPFEAVKQQLEPLVRQRQFNDHLDGVLKTAKVERSLPASATAAAPATGSGPEVQ
ncbi:MAG: peptidylprolyl isomerase [Gammaproteobacteria bacterium]|nr:peptidylprolyl isomerase [Gammaproteobacteria bacterium]